MGCWSPARELECRESLVRPDDPLLCPSGHRTSVSLVHPLAWRLLAGIYGCCAVPVDGLEEQDTAGSWE